MVAALLFVGLASLAAYAVEPAKTASRSFQRTLILPLGGAPVAAERQTLDLEAAHVTRLPRGALPAAFRGPPTARTGSLSPPVAFLELAPGGRLRPAAPPGLGCRPAEAYVAEHALKPAAAGASGSGAVAIVVFDCEPPMPAADLDLSARLGLLRPPAGLSLPVAAKRGIAWSRAAAAGARPDPVGAMVATSRRASRALTAARGSAPVSAAGPTSARTASSQAVVTTTSGARVAPAPSSARRLTSTTSGPQSSEPTSPGAAAESLEISIVGGDKQSGVVGQPFDEDLVVLVTRDDAPQGGVPVTWKVVTGRARLKPVDSTGIAGQASVQVVPQQAGTIEVTASLDADCTADKCVRFTLTAVTCEQPLTIDKKSGDDQTSDVDDEFDNPLVVEVQCNKEPLPGVLVVWTVSQGEADLDPEKPATPDPLPGQTHIWVTPRAAGRISITACPLEQPKTCEIFNLTATGGDATISIFSGNGQSTRVNQPFPEPLEARVLRDGDLEKDAEVTWEATGGAKLSPKTKTGGGGRAENRVTAGSLPGPIAVTASLPGAGPDCLLESTCVVFHLTATPSRPPDPRIEIVSGADQGICLGELFADLVVRVVDEAAEAPAPLPGSAVTWLATAGAAFLEDAVFPGTTTGQSGGTRLRGVNPVEAGRVTITARLPGAGVGCQAPDCVAFILTAVDCNGSGPPRLEPNGETSFSGHIGASFTLKVQLKREGVASQEGGILVDWSSSDSDAFDNLRPSVTSNGRAKVTVKTLKVGDFQVTAALGAGSGCESSCTVPFEITVGKRTLSVMTGDGQSKRHGEHFANLAVRVLDFRNQFDAGVRVSWKVVKGRTLLLDPSFDPTDSDSNGLATLPGPGLTPEGLGGPVEIEARLKNGLSKTFKLTAESSGDGNPNPKRPNESFTKAAPDLALRLADRSLGQILSRLAALRRGGPRLTTEFAAIEIQGVKVPVDALAKLGAPPERREGEFEVARLLSGGERGGGAGNANRRAQGRLGMFVSGIAAFGEGKRANGEGATEEPGFDFHTDGLMVGVDYDLGSFFAGGAVSFASTRSDLSGDLGAVDVEGLNLASYLLFFPDLDAVRASLYVDAVLMVGRNDFVQWRRGDVQEPGAAQVEDSSGIAHADFGGDQLALHLGAGYDRNFGPAVVGGFASLSYVAAEVEGYGETSEGNRPMWLVAVDRQKLTSLLASLGMDLSYYTWIRGGVLAPSLRIAYRRELEDGSRQVTGSFDGSLFDAPQQRFPETFRTAPPDQGYFNVALSLLASFHWGSFALGYDQDLARSDFDLQAITMGVRFGF